MNYGYNLPFYMYLYLFAYVCESVCKFATYTYAHHIGECHGIAKYGEIEVTEDLLESLQNWRVVLWWGRVLGRTHTHRHMKLMAKVKHNDD